MGASLKLYFGWGRKRERPTIGINNVIAASVRIFNTHSLSLTPCLGANYFGTIFLIIKVYGYDVGLGTA